MLSPKKLLENARNRIAKRENWVKGSLAVANKTELDVGGGYARVPVTSPEATCWCAIGAVAAESGEEVAYTLKGNHGEALKALARAAGFEAKDDYDSYRVFSAIYDVNDAKGHEAVLDLFDTAIADMKGE